MKIKIIGIFVCILLVAVSVSSAISTDIKPSISNYESEEDCGCGENKSTYYNYILCVHLYAMLQLVSYKGEIIGKLIDVFESNTVIVGLLYFWFNTLALRGTFYYILGMVISCWE